VGAFKNLKYLSFQTSSGQNKNKTASFEICRLPEFIWQAVLAGEAKKSFPPNQICLNRHNRLYPIPSKTDW